MELHSLVFFFFFFLLCPYFSINFFFLSWYFSTNWTFGWDTNITTRPLQLDIEFTYSLYNTSDGSTWDLVFTTDINQIELLHDGSMGNLMNHILNHQHIFEDIVMYQINIALIIHQNLYVILVLIYQHYHQINFLLSPK